MMMNWSQENCLIDNHRKKHSLFLTPASDGDGDFTEFVTVSLSAFLCGQAFFIIF